MRKARFLIAVVVALAATGCIRHEPDDVAGRGLFNSRPSAPRAYAQQPVQKPSVLQYAPRESPPRVSKWKRSRVITSKRRAHPVNSDAQPEKPLVERCCAAIGASL